MQILPNDLKRQYDLYADEYEHKAIEVLRSGWYVLGKEVSAFEQEFAAAIGAKHCVGVASGLDALWLSLRILGLGDGDEVIVCSNAYIACVMAITISGATPVFVEPDQYNNIDARRIEDAVSSKTRAILPVHLYGQACEMDLIMDIAHRYDLRVIEDCAQSHKSMYDDKTVGTFGEVGCFSFYPTKGLGAFGDSGAIVTDSDELADSFRMYRNYGSRKQYHFEVVGANSRLDELQAGLLRVKLTHLDEMNDERRRIARRYQEGIRNPSVTLPKVRPRAESTWHQYVIHSYFRDALREFLLERGIGTAIHYPIPPHLSGAYQYLGYKSGDFPIAESYAREVLSLPMYNGMSIAEQDQVISAINQFKVPT